MKKIIFLLVTALLLLTGTKASALGECGMACCISGSIGSGVMLAKNFGMSQIYENSLMGSIKKGRNTISPDTAIENNRNPGTSYKVPTDMRMQKITVAAVKPVSERLQIIAYIPYIVNDMDMRRKNAMGMVMDMKMPTAEGLGDITLLGLYTLYTDAPIRPRTRLTLGAGVKTPTGETNKRSSDGTLLHAMMQPGSGSWDPVVMVNYMKGFYPFVLQANLFYQMTTEGSNGYEFGDQFTVDLISRYQVHKYVNLGLDLNGIYAGKDSDPGGRYSVSTSLADNTANTGLVSLFISPVVQVKIPGGGGSAELKLQFPVYQNVNGEQLVLDWRAIGRVAWIF